ncbi:hypothetical protein J6590_033614 [Homalodisca vitripennis]|nr:hypothetical protein J6590_033614 [Homalodisca vitripennis]
MSRIRKYFSDNFGKVGSRPPLTPALEHAVTCSAHKLQLLFKGAHSECFLTVSERAAKSNNHRRLSAPHHTRYPPSEVSEREQCWRVCHPLTHSKHSKSQYKP